MPGPERRTASTSSSAGPDRALGVVLVGRRGAPHRHHRVADELLDGPAVAADDLARRARSSGSGARGPSSASRPSANGVKPTRSANRTETRRRSATWLVARGTLGRRRSGPGRRRQHARRAGRERSRALRAELGVGQIGRAAGRARAASGVAHSVQNLRRPGSRCRSRADHAVAVSCFTGPACASIAEAAVGPDPAAVAVVSPRRVVPAPGPSRRARRGYAARAGSRPG